MTRIVTTRPPDGPTASRFYREGYWRPALPAGDRLSHISAGGTRTALVDNNLHWTYQDLSGAVRTSARSMKAAGVTSDDAVLIVAPLTNAAAASYLATQLIGNVAVLLDRRCGMADVDTAFAAAPKIAWATRADATRLHLDARCPVLYLDNDAECTDSAPEDLAHIIDPDVASLVVFTSGTTSSPKGVVHTRNSLRCGVANMTAAMNVTGEDGFFLSSPLASITGVLQLETALAIHAAVILEDRFESSASLERLRRNRATLLGGAPIICDELFAECQRQNIDQLSLRCIALGGSMITQPVLANARRFGIEPVRVYGSSEAPFSTATQLGSGAALEDEGTALPGVEVAVGDSDELLIRGPHQFHGYLDTGDNDSGFSGQWVRTGDQAVIDDAHRVRISGRLKDVAIRKGMKVSLTEIDAAAAALGDCAAYAIADPATGERAALAIYPRSQSTLSYSAVTQQLLEFGLAKWKLPEQIVIWNRPLPRTPSGKVVRRQLSSAEQDCQTFYAPRLTRTAPSEEE
ncbi:AMP-binding protein [Mycobacterium sp. CPCC 205372]|uniref:AMP-binding protein n=1 Tax=Mycobacterium hippophais TaxID=3016340 RepID=A0ABT4PLB0_9MYCO|nr:AMP-binding protein [Mycobacterium hippophais]MCZ8377341.1 AMP-binding protein [Mycobacterium hippophais]